jgi:hypothetical protein
MVTILLGIGFMLIFGLSLGLSLVIKGKPLQGTCASQSAALAKDGITCSVCGKMPGSCTEDDKKTTATA